MTRRWWPMLMLTAVGCGLDDTRDPEEALPHARRIETAAAESSSGIQADPEAPEGRKTQPPMPAEAAPVATPRLDPLAKHTELLNKLEKYNTAHASRRVHVQVDKPLYAPGETIWIKAWDLRTRDLQANGKGQGFTFTLVSPKGVEVLEKRVQAALGHAHNDFELPASVPGGEYVVRVTALDELVGERKIVVSTYEAPRIKKKLEFTRKAYGVGDEVVATLELKRPTGEPLRNQVVRAQVVADGRGLPEIETRTNAEGGALVRFTLPAQLEVGDVLLTALVDESGVTESVSKRVPVVLKKLEVAFFPEGGDWVEGLPSRVYFEAKNPMGKPADVEGEIIDDKGQVVQRFRSYKNGLGRFELTPNTGRKYTARVTQPVGVTESFAMPLPKAKGCTLRTFDDPDGEVAALRAAVQCTDDRTVVVAGTVRESVFDMATVAVSSETPAIVHLAPASPAVRDAMGVARVTVFSEELTPLAERVVFRNRRKGLKIAIEPNATRYTPRDAVELTVRATDATGAPVEAELAVSVVDDTVIAFADDKEAHMLSATLLQPEIPGTVEEPNFYFDLEEKKSALAMELLMGTRGWRKFEWRPVLEEEQLGLQGRGRGGGGLPPMPMPMPMPVHEMPPAMKPDIAKAEVVAPVAAKAKAPMRMRDAEEAEAPMPKAAARKRPIVAKEIRAQPMAEPAMAEGKRAKIDADWIRAGLDDTAAEPPPKEWAPVRVFPQPDYPPEYSGPRTDFRQTIHWAPRVATGKDGKAKVKFHTSDAITSFRIFAEGAGGGQIGRKETVIASSLPFSMNVKLPLEVSAGDMMQLPLTLTNELDREVPIRLAASFGSLLHHDDAQTSSVEHVAANSGTTLYFAVDVTGTMGESEVRFAADAGGLRDEFTRTVHVVPPGFPQFKDKSGTLAGAPVVHTFDLGDAQPQTSIGKLKVYTTPISTLIGGLEGLIRQPSGCFEQTSSSNYPNVMVMQYLETHDVAVPAVLARTKPLIEEGYRKLVSFETADKGYEWFGQSPPHEALSAYGVLEFIDMKQVYGGVDDAMVRRTIDYLKSRRDGKGGFQRNSAALDSFGAASPEVTDAYITYAIAEAGLAGEFVKEISTQKERSAKTSDPYLLALAANALLHVPSEEATASARLQRLAAMQSADGSWTGADHSITRSGGENLTIETTALAMLALSKRGYAAEVRKGMAWLTEHRNGYGQWGATQATVLALKAMTQYANLNRGASSAGAVTVLVNGQEVERVRYEAGQSEPLGIEFGDALVAGKNTIELRHRGEGQLPYSMAVEYRAVQPATDPNASIEVKTSLGASQLKMGETTRLTATVTNRTDAPQPMTLARIGLPGGLTTQTWQLKELREKGVVDFYETRAREVILYWRGLGPSESREVPIELVADVPGKFSGPASTAYLYYTDEQKFWAPGVEVRVTP